MSPYRDREKQKKAVREDAKKRRMLHDFLKFENFRLMNTLAVSEEKTLLVRAVGVNTDTRKKEGNWVCWLSRFAVDEKKFLDHLEDAKFCYATKLGHYYLIKKASQEEIEIFLKEHEKAKEGYYSGTKHQ